MHKYMRAIGFSEYTDRKKLNKLLQTIITDADEREYAVSKEHVIQGVFYKSFADRIGIALYGEFDESENFIYDYYFPYLKSYDVTTTEDVNIERHAAR